MSSVKKGIMPAKIQIFAGYNASYVVFHVTKMTELILVTLTLIQRRNNVVCPVGRRIQK